MHVSDMQLSMALQRASTNWHEQKPIHCSPPNGRQRNNPMAKKIKKKVKPQNVVNAANTKASPATGPKDLSRITNKDVVVAILLRPHGTCDRGTPRNTA